MSSIDTYLLSAHEKNICIDFSGTLGFAWLDFV
jgi:hypothetical protein